MAGKPGRVTVGYRDEVLARGCVGVCLSRVISMSRAGYSASGRDGMMMRSMRRLAVATNDCVVLDRIL